MAIVLGGLHAIVAIQNQSMNADGIAYLDIGDAYFHADWSVAINAVWSPLYSWLLGFVNFAFKPPMAWEFSTVHIINFFIYLFTLTCFGFMWSNVRDINKQHESDCLSDSIWWILGYLLFIWIALSLIQMWAVTPDMLMAGFVCVAGGLIAKIRAGDGDHRLFLALGLTLGLGYLSKTFMFSMAPVFLALAWLVQKRTWSAFRLTLLATSIFLLISVPFIILISNVKGKLTIGEAGIVTFLRYVNGMPFPHWQGDSSLGIVPTHPSRVIHQAPAVYEFGEPIGGTYPITLDPSYWYEGIEAHFELGGLVARLLSSGLVYAELFFQQQGILSACILALYVMGQRQKISFGEILYKYALVIPAVVAFGLYATILVQSRYIGVFILLFWADILANIRLSKTVNNKTWLNVLGGIAALGLFVNIAIFNLDGLKRLNPTMGITSITRSAPPAKPLEVAQALHEFGIGHADRVGVIGYAYDSFWARLARVKIVAEMFESEAIDDFWSEDVATQKRVLQSFADADVSAVVAEYVPADATLDGWYQVGQSNYYIYVFTEQRSP